MTSWRATLNAFYYLARIIAHREFAYKKRAFLVVLQSLLSLYAFVYLWKALLSVNATEQQTLQSFVTYSILASILSACLPGEVIARLFTTEVEKGNIAYTVLRPLSIVWAALATSAGTIISSIMMRVVPLLCASLFFGPLVAPSNPVTWACFLVSLLCGLTITVLIDLLTGYLCFWIFQGAHVRHFFEALLIAFSGRFVPLSLLPGWFTAISLWIPARLIYYDPIGIYTGLVAPTEYFGTFLRSAAWIIVLLAIVVRLHRAGLKRIFIQGG